MIQLHFSNYSSHFIFYSFLSIKNKNRSLSKKFEAFIFLQSSMTDVKKEKASVTSASFDQSKNGSFVLSIEKIIESNFITSI